MMRDASDYKIRGFRVTVQPGDQRYGITLEETNGHIRNTVTVARADDVQTLAVLPSVMAAVKTSGHTRTVLSPQRNAPIVLSEEAGVRLALALIATAPVTKPRRIEAILGGIDNMATEEAYYWYSKCMGLEASQVRKALRIFLAKE